MTMTPNEAIANLNHIYGMVSPDIQRSLDMAIKALEERRRKIMRILTKTQYDAICDIVTEKDNKIKELEAKLQKKQEIVDYLNDKLFKRTEQLLKLQQFCKYHDFYFPVDPKTQLFDVDFPIIRSENKLF